MPDMIERATKAIDLFDAICDIHDPAVSAHDRRVRAMAKVLEAAPSPSPAPGVVEALREAKKRFIQIENCIARNLFHQQEKIKDAQSIATDGWSALDAALASLAQPAKDEREGGGQALVDADQNVASNEAAATPANPAQAVSGLDADKIATWPPLKKAIWDVVTFEQLNDGHYIDAYDLTDKLHFAVTAANPAQVTDAMVEAGHNGLEEWRRLYVSKDEVRAILTAAIGAGGQAVAAVELGGKAIRGSQIATETQGLLRDPLQNYVTIEDAFSALSALSAIAHPVQPGWRDMESAPKDGTEILVCGPAKEGGAYLDVQRWPKNWSSKWPVSYMAYAAGEPTHWMPLPAAPQPKGE